MDVVVLDTPLLLAGIALLVAGRVALSKAAYQALCQAIGTFSAQISLGVSLSLGRVVPFFSASALRKPVSRGLFGYLPFAIYATLATIAGCLTWEVPAGVSYWYGEGRALVQLANFLALALSAIALESELGDDGSVHMLWTGLQVVACIHGLVSLYQLLAPLGDLPLVGISRPFGLTSIEGVGDLAAFRTASGDEIIRPGGLMGEPKTAAVLFGAVLLTSLFSGNNPRRRWERLLRWGTTLLAATGFVAAMSSSAFAGLLGAVMVLIWLKAPGIRVQRLVVKITAISLVTGIAWVFLYRADAQDLASVLRERTIDRYGEVMDPPVTACLNAVRQDAALALFGTGLGGSSFIVMKYLNSGFAYAYAPNIGIVLLVAEVGLVGTVLFLFPFARQATRTARALRHFEDVNARLLLCLGVSVMAICLAGSGMPLGWPLAIACVASATRRARELVPHWGRQGE